MNKSIVEKKPGDQACPKEQAAWTRKQISHTHPTPKLTQNQHRAFIWLREFLDTSTSKSIPAIVCWIEGLFIGTNMNLFHEHSMRLQLLIVIAEKGALGPTLLWRQTPFTNHNQLSKSNIHGAEDTWPGWTLTCACAKETSNYSVTRSRRTEMDVSKVSVCPENNINMVLLRRNQI